MYSLGIFKLIQPHVYVCIIWFYVKYSELMDIIFCGFDVYIIF